LRQESKILLLTITQWGALPSIQSTGIDKLIFGDLVESKRKYRAFAQAQAAELTQVKTERLDFYHYLLSAVDPDTGSKYSAQELWAEANVLIVAGSDTSTNVMAATFFYLLHNTRALEKATKEAREAFAGDDVEAIRSGPLLNGCHYLRACLDESMRFSPAVPGMLPRTVLPG
jgi:cytochrome P450